jgi:acyl-coenzyme A synthetase/AMP-(fatty) acid ligase/acyl carrier protein
MSDQFKHTGNLPPEQEAIRARCFHPTGAFLKFSEQEVEQSVPDRFEKIVQRNPDRIAVKAGDQVSTYEALNKLANRIAWSIYHERGAIVEPIVLISQHDLNGIASCLGILKAGKILVVVDPSFPIGRIGNMLENSLPGAIVTDRKNLSFAKSIAKSELQVIDMEDFGSNLSEANLGLRVAPDAPAQIVYSSGSTGQAKGIFFNHRRILHDVMGDVNAPQICPDDRIILLYKLTFSAGMRVLFQALLSGAAIFPYDIKEKGLADLATFLVRERITTFRPGNSIFRHFVNQQNGTDEFPLIRLVEMGGGPLFKSDVDAYKKLFSGKCVLLHRFSSSETGNLCRYFMDKEAELIAATVPAGYPVEGKEILLLDDSGRAVERNQVGEIAVRSRYLSSGYWRDPELTNIRFRPDPDHPGQHILLTGDLGQMTLDGCLLHLGRKDFTVKIRGYRVEITEVERTLLTHPQIKEAGVVAWARESGEMYLAGYIVPRRHPAPKISEVRKFLTEKLPEYMIPATFLLLDSLPVTNGKLDRKALPKPDDKRPELSQPYVESRSELEQKLAGIWETALAIHPIGIHDDFFDLGGHSLVATRIISQIHEVLRTDVSMRSLLDAPTVAGLAEVIEALRWTATNADALSSGAESDDETGEL